MSESERTVFTRLPFFETGGMHEIEYVVTTDGKRIGRIVVRVKNHQGLVVAESETLNVADATAAAVRLASFYNIDFS